jgi:hypothetical protein
MRMIIDMTKESQSKRLAALEEMKTRYPHAKRFAQLSKKEVTILYDFVKENDHLAKDDFMLKVSRHFLGDPNKPKNWGIIDELLCNINSHH